MASELPRLLTVRGVVVKSFRETFTWKIDGNVWVLAFGGLSRNGVRVSQERRSLRGHVVYSGCWERWGKDEQGIWD